MASKTAKRTSARGKARKSNPASGAASSSPLRPLTPKERQFVEEYLVDLNSAAAARRCGYSERTAKEQGYDILRKPAVAAAISERAQERAQKTGLTAERVLGELMKVAFVDIADAYDADGKLKAIHDMPEHCRRAIAGVETEELWDVEVDEDSGRKVKVQTGVTRKVKFWDKLKANELLGKNLKLFVDKIEHSADGSFADMLREARQRAQSA